MLAAYIYQAAFFCKPCGERLRAGITNAGNAPENPDDPLGYDSDDFPKPIVEGESDRPEHCAHCAVFLENPITLAGFDYILAQAQRHLAEDCEKKHPNCVIRKWIDFYGTQLPEPEEKQPRVIRAFPTAASAALKAIRRAQIRGEKCAYLSVDIPLDTDDAFGLGIALEELLVGKFDSMQQLNDTVTALVASKSVDLIVAVGAGV